MNRINVIDPGFDHEVQEIEEFISPKPEALPSPSWTWNGPVEKINHLIVFDYGLASKWASSIKEKSPVAILGEDEWRDDHGAKRGVALYKVKGLHLLLTGADYESNVLCEAIYSIAKNSKISVISLQNQSPDKQSELINISATSKQSGFHVGTGLGATLVTLYAVRSSLENQVSFYKGSIGADWTSTLDAFLQDVQRDSKEQLKYDEKKSSRLFQQSLPMYL